MVNRGGHSLVSEASYNAAPHRPPPISDPGAAGPSAPPFNARPPPAGERVIRVAKEREWHGGAPENLAERGASARSMLPFGRKGFKFFPPNGSG